MSEFPVTVAFGNQRASDLGQPLEAKSNEIHEMFSNCHGHKSVKVGKQRREIQLVYYHVLLEESVRQSGSSRDVVGKETRQ